MDKFCVRVRRQDSVMLMDELTRFMDDEIPEAVSKYMAYPQSFDHNKEALQNIQCSPEEARARFAMPLQRGPGGRKVLQTLARFLRHCLKTDQVSC